MYTTLNDSCGLLLMSIKDWWLPRHTNYEILILKNQLSKITNPIYLKLYLK